MSDGGMREDGRVTADGHYRRIPGITLSRGRKWDVQIKQAHIAEKRLAEVFAFGTFDITMELKTETLLWEKTENLCIEYKYDGRPSGISTTEAGWWVHQLGRDNIVDDIDTVGYFLVPMERMKALARQAIREGRCHKKAGDGGKSQVALVRIKDLWKK